jgi:predicted nucleic acid-binding Zn ribbon protein
LNWNRRKALPDWEKRRIRNRHEKYLRKEKRSACVMALLVLAIIVVGIVGQIILVGGV